jgi:hypothetical protein
LQAGRVRAVGFEPRIAKVQGSGQTLFAVQVGRARTYAEAEVLAGRLRRAGLMALVVP